MPQSAPRDHLAACARQLGLAVDALAPQHLLPMLHALQAARDGLDASHLTALADALGVGRAEVFGAASCYADLRVSTTGTPPTAPLVELCGADACHARGAAALLAATAGRDDVRTVYCLGQCARGPCARVDHRLMVDLDRDRLLQLLASAPS